MFQIDKTIVSDQLIEKAFVCDLSACKGACCVEGDAGAPLEEKELELLEKNIESIKPFLTSKGIESLNKNGLYVKGEDDSWETPLVDQAECAYTIFENGKAFCGIEKAYKEGAIDWVKPISCHLYPVRLKSYSEFTAVNYHKWHICDTACQLGESLQIPVYKFLKNALIRRFGSEWYHKLEAIAQKEL